MIKTWQNRAACVGMLGALLLLTIPDAGAVDDGLGTNYTGIIRATGIELSGTLRTAWPARTDSIGGTVDFRTQSNRVVWAPVVRLDGQLETARLQTDAGTADALIVRAAWNDAWDAYTIVNSITATTGGVADSTWSSSWISNSFRIGVIVTNFTTGTNLWWSVDYTE